MEKTTREKILVQIEELNQKVSSERRKTKEIPTKIKTIQTKQDIPKQRKIFLSTIERA